MTRIKYNQITGYLLFGTCLFLAVISVYLCFSNDIWYDELFTIGLAEQNLAGLFQIAAADVHPPLYYLIVKGVLMAGSLLPGSPDGVVLAKILSAVPFLLLLGYGWVKVQRTLGILTAGIFCFLVFTMPQLSQYMVEMRMYSFCIFFVTAGLLHAYDILFTSGEGNRNQAGNWIGMTICLLAAAYLHYYAFVAAAMVYLCLLAGLLWSHAGRKKRRLWLASAATAAAAYLPWVTAVIRQAGQVQENYWIQPLTWRSIGGCVKFLFKPAFADERLNTVLAVIMFTVFVLLVVWGLKTAEKEHKLLIIACLGVMAGVVLFGFVASAVFRPIFIYRYMLPAVGVFWLAFACLLGRLLREKAVFYVILGLFVLVGLRNFRAFYGEEMWKRVQMEQTAAVLNRVAADDILIFNFNHTQGVVSYYLDNDSYLYDDRPEILIQEMFPRAAGMEDWHMIQDWLEAGRTVWFLGSGNAREELREIWAAAGINSEEKASCLIERYWFNLYSLNDDLDV